MLIVAQMTLAADNLKLFVSVVTEMTDYHHDAVPWESYLRANVVAVTIMVCGGDCPPGCYARSADGRITHGFDEVANDLHAGTWAPLAVEDEVQVDRIGRHDGTAMIFDALILNTPATVDSVAERRYTPNRLAGGTCTVDSRSEQTGLGDHCRTARQENCDARAVKCHRTEE